MKVYSINAPHFYAGIEVQNDTVVKAAPILGYMHGWHMMRVNDYAKRRGWLIIDVPLQEHPIS